MKTYHYCVSFDEPGRTHWMHGVIRHEGDLMESGSYARLCSNIAASMTPPREAKGVIVHSLNVVDDDSPAPPRGPQCLR